VRRVPRSLRADPGCESVEDSDEPFHLRAGRLPHGEHVAAVDGPGSVGGDVDAVTVAVPRVGLLAEFCDEVEQCGLGGGDPLPAEFVHLSVDVIGPGAAPDPVTGLEDGDAASRLAESACGAQPGRARSDDDDVTGVFRHGDLLRRGCVDGFRLASPPAPAKTRGGGCGIRTGDRARTDSHARAEVAPSAGGPRRSEKFFRRLGSWIPQNHCTSYLPLICPAPTPPTAS